MDEERRKELRNELHLKVALNINDLTIPCQVKNLSSGGSLLMVDENFSHLINDFNIGNRIACWFHSTKKEGSIVRLYEENGNKFLAMRYLF